MLDASWWLLHFRCWMLYAGGGWKVWIALGIAIGIWFGIWIGIWIGNWIGGPAQDQLRTSSHPVLTLLSPCSHLAYTSCRQAVDKLVSSSSPPSSNFQLPTPNFQLPTSNFQLPMNSTRSLLNTSLPTMLKYNVFCKVVLQLLGNNFRKLMKPFERTLTLVEKSRGKRKCCNNALFALLPHVLLSCGKSRKLMKPFERTFTLVEKPRGKRKRCNNTVFALLPHVLLSCGKIVK